MKFLQKYNEHIHYDLLEKNKFIRIPIEDYDRIIDSSQEYPFAGNDRDLLQKVVANIPNAHVNGAMASTGESKGKTLMYVIDIDVNKSWSEVFNITKVDDDYLCIMNITYKHTRQSYEYERDYYLCEDDKFVALSSLIHEICENYNSNINESEDFNIKTSSIKEKPTKVEKEFDFKTVTWEDVLGYNENDIDWVGCDKDDITSSRKRFRHTHRGIINNYPLTLSKSITVLSEDDYHVIFKHNDCIAVICVYESQGVSIFKDIVVCYGNVRIIVYDSSDFTHKIIYTD